MAGPVDVDASAFVELRQDLKRLAPDVARELNRELRAVVRDRLVPAARANAAWSSRIPEAIAPTVTAKHAGLRLAAGRAPHGRLYEGGPGRMRWRHPVFGNRNVWVEQTSRPFIQPAVDEHGDTAVAAALDAVDTAARTAGFT